MFALNIKDVPKLEEILKAPSETKICTACGHPKDIEAFGWRYCYTERLEICKYCRNRTAKVDRIKKRFKEFNKLTMMKW